MRSMSKLLSAGAALAITTMSMTASAAPGTTDGTSTWCTTRVTNVIKWPNGQLSVMGPEFRSGSASIFVCDSLNAGTCDAYQSLAMMAMLSGREIVVKLTGNALNCSNLNTHPTIQYVGAK